LEILTDAAVLIEGDRIAAVGPERELRSAAHDATVTDVQGVLFPGLVDAHTHGVFGAERTGDHERRALGLGYKEIAAAGGGILESVRDLRRRSESELVAFTRRRLLALLAHGTTTVEVKSGYGLAADHELKQLRVIRQLATELPLQLVPTFLGAHEVPEEHRSQPERYVELVLNEMLPAVVADGLARYCDVFCEPGVFTPGQSRAVLDAARDLGLGLRLHADELEASGGAELAAELGAASADHLAAVSQAGVSALAAAPTVAVLLPATQLFLGRTARAPARRLIESGVPVALATDFNPGSSPTPGLPVVMTLGMSQLGLSAAEVVIGVTVNAAASLGLAERAGQIAAGCRADLVLFDAGDWREVPYWCGANLVRQVWCGGSPCLDPARPVSCSVSSGSVIP
jgi:imidazolonepropionase